VNSFRGLRFQVDLLPGILPFANPFFKTYRSGVALVVGDVDGALDGAGDGALDGLLDGATDGKLNGALDGDEVLRPGLFSRPIIFGFVRIRSVRSGCWFPFSSVGKWDEAASVLVSNTQAVRRRPTRAFMVQFSFCESRRKF
jgi:hypothetical protein